MSLADIANSNEVSLVNIFQGGNFQNAALWTATDVITASDTITVSNLTPTEINNITSQVLKDTDIPDNQKADVIEQRKSAHAAMHNERMHRLGDFLMAKELCRFIGKSLSANIQSSFPKEAAKKYYVAVPVLANSPKVSVTVCGVKKNHSGSGKLERISFIIESLDNTNGIIKVEDARAASFNALAGAYFRNWNPVLVTKIMVFCLTDLFGAGKEPVSTEEFESAYLDVYFKDQWWYGVATSTIKKVIMESNKRMDRITLSVKELGAVGGGIADDTCPIQAAIAILRGSGGRLILDNDIYNVVRTIEVPANVILDLNGGEIRTSEDINLIQLRQHGSICNGRLKILKEGYTKAAIYIDGEDVFDFLNQTIVRDISIDSTNTAFSRSGKAIHLYAGSVSNGGDRIQFVNMDNIHIKNFAYGIHIECSKVLGQYINGNNFNNFFMENFTYGIYIDCKLLNASQQKWFEASCNVFSNFQMQSGIYHCLRFFYLTGASNHVSNAVLFDVPDTPYIEFGKESSSCTVSILNVSVGDGKVIDNGVNNFLTGRYSGRFLGNSLILPGSFPERKIFNGDQDDFLAYMHLRYANAVVQTAGPTPKAGALENIFIPDSHGVTFPASDPSDPIVLEILCNTYWIDYIVFFTSGSVARNYKIEVYEDNAWTELIAVQGNYTREMIAKNTLNHITKIRLTMWHTAPIEIKRVSAHSSYGLGKTFMPLIGGTVYGDIAFYANGKGPVLVAPNGKRYRLTVDNNGTLSTQAIT